jgi:Family of unknown function (DUF5856)
MTPLRVKQKLFEARDVIHDLHLNTISFAEHTALGSFYSDWTDLLDSFLETYYGKYGRIKGTITIDSSTDLKSDEYLKQLMVFVCDDFTLIVEPLVDSDLENIIADMKQLINHTLYKLSLR